MPGEVFGCEFLENLATFPQGKFDQVFAVRPRQEVKSDECSRRFFRQFLDSALGGMNPLQEVVKRKASIDRNRDFTV